MKKIIFIWILFVCLPLNVKGEVGAIHESPLLTVNPTGLFVGEDRDLVFEARETTEENQNVNLAEINPITREVKFHWVMNDSGILGDLKKGDGIFSRKVEFKEKRPQTLIFGIYFENKIPEKIRDDSKTVLVSIIRRPTFIEVVKQALSKLKN